MAVVGDGWWSASLAEEAERLGVTDLVEFTGFVDGRPSTASSPRAWVLALPSLKEGWGLTVVMEAAGYAVPTVGYAAAGRVAESVVDGVTGIPRRRRAASPPRCAGCSTTRSCAVAWAWPPRRAPGEFGWDTAARSFAGCSRGPRDGPSSTALEAVPEIEPAHIHRPGRPAGRHGPRDDDGRHP